jgi:hypothetical protein
MTPAKIIPLSFVMVAGPQILSAIFLATSEDWAGSSAPLVGDAAVPRASGRCACCSSARGAKTPPPKVRDWMNDNSWTVSECVIGLFVIITASIL